MAQGCVPQDMFLSKDKRTCCNRCPAGEYVLKECDSGRKTECHVCPHEFYMATRNHMEKCLPCRKCTSSHHQIAQQCEAKHNRQCECTDGYFCMSDDCDSCQEVNRCPIGQGVVRKATRTNDTVCAQCPEGTYSNVTDYVSPCRNHTRCEVLKTEGNTVADAVCAEIACPSWLLPAGLWAGLVVTALLLVLSYVIYHQVKQRSCKKACGAAPVVCVADTVSPIELSFPMAEWSTHCQESSDKELYKFATPDDTGVRFCTQDSVEDSILTSPVTASPQLVPGNHRNGNGGICTSPFMRTHSEPQEDEWGGV